MSDAHPQPQIMGILNVTPDSFSDGGRFVTGEEIVQQVQRMIDAGADIIDVGGESSRPGAEAVSEAEELARVLPPIQAIRDHHDIAISVDTTKANVARQAMAAGADIINDISGLRNDPQMIDVVRETGARTVLMHMQGTPRTMQNNPVYDNLITDIENFLQERVTWAVSQGVAKEKLIVDPGIGFGKTVQHNLSLLKHLAAFKKIGCPVLIGHSRKAFIGATLDREVTDRDTATAIVSALCVTQGVDILRVHDVDKTAQAIRMTNAVLAAF